MDATVARLRAHGLRLLVVGCPRSGTGWAARVLTAAGVPCGHEARFHRNRIGLDRVGLNRVRALVGPRLVAESSWLAVPALDHLGDRAVVHAVRHPLGVVASLLGIDFFRDPDQAPWRRVVEDHLPLTGDPLVDGMRFWTAWNRRVEPHADVRVRTGEWTADDVVAVAALGGVAVGAEDARRALASVPGDVNTRRRASLDWSDLPAGPDRDALASLAERYGFTVG